MTTLANPSRAPAAAAPDLAATIAALRRLADALEARSIVTDVDVTLNDRVVTASIDEVRGLLDALRPRRAARSPR